jgi:mono/diheme cytochrome c family protein
MRWTTMATWIAVSCAGVLLAFAVSCSTQTTSQQASVAAPDPIARGRYLSLTMGCGDCHTPGSFYGTPDTTRLLSGSELGWHGPWGVSYPRNLTPDVETGLGKWSEEDIVKAITTGVRPDGSPLLPPMPWPDFAHLTHEDAHALAAYLKTIPAVKHQMPAVVPPSQKPTGAFLSLPSPPAWDAQNLPPPAAP